MLITAIEIGLLYSLVSLGVYLTFHILNFPDLTVDGSLVSGAAATAVALTHSFPVYVAVGLGFLAGAAAGGITSILHVKCGIGKIFSGILSIGILYTLNLRLMGGPNISLLNQPSLSFLQVYTPLWQTIIFLTVVVAGIKFTLDWFLQTEFGCQLRATGDNEAAARSFAIVPGKMKSAGIILSNGIVGLAGALIAQFQGFADVNMGFGTIILALAALMVGESFNFKKNFFSPTTLIVIGSVVYQIIIQTALRLGLAGTDLKLVSALIIILAIVSLRHKTHFFHDNRFFNN